VRITCLRGGADAAHLSERCAQLKCGLTGSALQIPRLQLHIKPERYVLSVGSHVIGEAQQIIPHLLAQMDAEGWQPELGHAVSGITSNGAYAFGLG
jgi:hypothetical protein